MSFLHTLILLSSPPWYTDRWNGCRESHSEIERVRDILSGGGRETLRLCNLPRNSLWAQAKADLSGIPLGLVMANDEKSTQIASSCHPWFEHRCDMFFPQTLSTTTQQFKKRRSCWTWVCAIHASLAWGGIQSFTPNEQKPIHTAAKKSTN